MNRLLYNPATVNCCASLFNGDVIAYPTEAVWGLGCDPWNPHAVSKLLTLKQRAIEKGLILVAANCQQLDFLFRHLSEQQQQILKASWPGHVSWLVPHRGHVPDYLSGFRDTIAVRVSSHPVVSVLCEAFGGPLVSTSANPQGMSPARQRAGVQRYFAQHGLAFGPGEVGGAASPSQIRDLRSGKIIRA